MRESGGVSSSGLLAGGVGSWLEVSLSMVTGANDGLALESDDDSAGGDTELEIIVGL